MVFWHWLVIAALFAVIEIAAPATVCLWLAAAALGVAAIDWLSPELPWEHQALIFAILAIAGVVIGRMTLARLRPMPSDGRLNTRIIKAYEARDACLAKNAAADIGLSLDAARAAQAVSLACVPETEKLVEVSNRDGDPKVAEAIRKDSEFRAMGYVLRARGEVTN